MSQASQVTSPAPASDDALLKSGPLDIVKYRKLYLGFSLAFLLPGLVFMVLMAMQQFKENGSFSPLRLGIDFTGGTILEYGFAKPVLQSDLPAIRAVFDDAGYTGAVVQIQQTHAEEPSAPVAAETASGAGETSTAEPAALQAASTKPAATKTTEQPDASAQEPAEINALDQLGSVVSIRSKQIQGDDAVGIQNALQQQFGQLSLLQKSSVGPTMASELIINGLLALVLAYVLIVGYLTYRFQLDYAVCAIIALVHDTLFVVGFFAMLGFLFHTEIDSLFITGILTVIGFSVHDTIVVFDRLRENTRVLHSKKLPFTTIANLSVNQTLARSVNTSLTALLPLVALYVWGGATTKDFVLVMVLGITVGTYSSISVASLLLAWWRGEQTGSAQAGGASSRAAAAV